MFSIGLPSRVSVFAIAGYVFLAYLFTLPVNGVKAANYIFLYGSFFILVISFAVERVVFPKVDRSAWFLFVYAIVVVLAICINQIDVASSLKRLRTGLGEQLYVLLFSLLYLHKNRSAKLLVAAMALGYSLLIGVTVVKIGLAWLSDSSLLDGDFHIRRFSPGYGITSLFFLPVLFGYLVTFCRKIAHRLAWLGVGLVGFALEVSYNSTSSVAFVGIYLLYLGMRHLRSRYEWGYGRMALVGVVGLSFLVASISSEGMAKLRNQYAQLLGGNKYELLSQRVGIWAVGIDCAMDAPWYGYGYGQKKVALVCGNEKYSEPARLRNNSSADYFNKENYGGVGFHNQYIENLFVGGWVGFLSWLACFAGAFRAAWRKRSTDTGLQNIVLPIIPVYLAGCLFNGLWEAQPMTKALMVMLAWAWWKPADPTRTCA